MDFSHLQSSDTNKSIGFQSGIDKWIWYPFKNLDEKYRSS